MSDVVVRRLEPADWQVLRDVRLAALSDAPDAFITRLPQAQGYTEADWRERLGGAGWGFTVAAWRWGQPVGMAGGYLHDGQPELVAMWVAPAARGSGAAGALIDAVAAWAVSTGSADLVLWVVEGNERAERAYARLGFVRTGRSQPVPGRPRDTEVEMVRRLP